VRPGTPTFALQYDRAVRIADFFVDVFMLLIFRAIDD
jgi:hypothetical protein